MIEQDAENINLIKLIRDLEDRLENIERFALTSQGIYADFLELGGLGVDMLPGDLSFSGDGFTKKWTNYSDTSTITGWSSYSNKEIYYKKIGKLVFVQFFIYGVSDTNTATFTLPFTPTTVPSHFAFWLRGQDDGTWQGGAMGYVVGGIATLYAYTTASGATWTDSGNKTIQGEFWYETV